VSDPFTTFGIAPAFEVDMTALEQRFRDLSRVVHPDKFVGGAAGERRRALSMAVDVNAAYRVLRDPVKRAEALLARHGVVVGEEHQPKASAALLLEVLEQREELSEAKQKRDRVRVGELAALASAREASVLSRLAAAFAALARSGEERDAALSLLGELKYLRRFLDEVRAIEEELA